ncbi:MAG: hypothetical protein QJR02_00350 [Sinobacteraceae bacterium]|nr:hypothetical protein [Nevskiaceae bacterium]
MANTDLAEQVEHEKDQILDLGLRIQALQEQLHSAPGLPVRVYLAAPDTTRLVVSVDLAIDGTQEASYRLRPDEAEALAPDGLIELARFDLEPGEHRLRARLVLRDTRRSATAADLERHFEGTFPASAACSAVTLEPVRGGWFSSDSLRLRPDCAVEERGNVLFEGVRKFWGVVIGTSDDDVVRYRRGDEDDPRVRNARFLERDGQYLQAALDLLQLNDAAPIPIVLPSYYSNLAQALARYGVLQRAQWALSQALHDGLTAQAAMPVRLQIAAAYYRRGELELASQTLGETAPKLRDKGQLVAWQDLKSRILLAQDRQEEALGILRVTDNLADFESYVRYYNFGTTLIRNGSAPQGLTILDRIGSIHGTSPDMQALSDRANLVLGAYFLHHGQGATAIPILERIRSRGPYSNRALLNLGWAFLAPAGSKQQRVSLGDERVVGPPPESVGAQLWSNDQNLYQRYHLRPFTRAKLESDEEARYKHALAIWSELIERDPQDDAVQQGLLAVAYALNQLGADDEARRFYERAADVVQETISSLAAAERYVRDHQWITELVQAPDPGQRFDRTLHTLPRASIAATLSDILAGKHFQALVAAERDLATLASRLNEWDAVLSALQPSATEPLASDPETPKQDPGQSHGPANMEILNIRARIADRFAENASLRGQIENQMEQELLDDLNAQRGWKTKMLTDTRLTLARFYQPTVH